MSEPARPRPGRTPTPRLSDHRAQGVRAARSFLVRSRRQLGRWVRARAHLGRASLQFRVVSSTMLLGLAVVLLLGSYLFSAISDGLEQDRIESAKVETSRLTSEVQASFDNSDRTSSEADLNLLARQTLGSAA